MVDLPIYSNQKTMIFHRCFINHHKSHHKPNTVNFPWKTRFVVFPRGLEEDIPSSAGKPPRAPWRRAVRRRTRCVPMGHCWRRRIRVGQPIGQPGGRRRGEALQKLGYIQLKFAKDCWVLSQENAGLNGKISWKYMIYIYIGLNFCKTSTCDDTGMMVYIQGRPR